MKWLLLLLIVLGGVWWLRQSKRGQRPTLKCRDSAIQITKGSHDDHWQCRIFFLDVFQ